MSYLTDRINEVREEKNKKDSYLQNKINQVKGDRAKKGQYTGSGYGGFGQQRTIVPGLYDLAVQKQSKVSSASAFEERYPEYMAQFQRGTEAGTGTPVSTRQPGGGGVTGGGFGAHGARAEHTPGENAARGSSTVRSGIFDNADNRVSSLANSPYAEILNRDDYAELSRAGESRLSWIPWKNDLVYDYINDINGQREQQEMSEVAHEAGGVSLARYNYMTEDEIGVYNYLYATEGKKAANKFLESLEADLNRQYYSGALAYNQQEALEHPFLYSAATVAAQPARTLSSSLALGQDAIRGFTDREIDPYSPLRQMSRMTSDVRNAIGENSEAFRNMAMYNPDIQNAALTYEQFGSGQENPFAPEDIDTETARRIGNFAYQITMTALDSMVNAFMAQGLAGMAFPGLDLATTAGVDKLMKATNVIGSLTMSSEVASLGVAEAKEKGYSDAGALGIGLIRGAIEYASEAIGGEWVIRNVRKDPLNLVKSTLLNQIPEGVEEIMSDVGNESVNLLLDAIFGTQESEIRALLQHYEQDGTDWERENPGWALLRDLGIKEFESFLGGALASFGSSSVQTANINRGINATSQRLGTTAQNVVQLMNDYQTESPGDIYEMAERLNARNEAELRQKAGEGSKAAEILEEARKSDEGNKDKFQGVAQAFRDAGIPLTNSEIRTLTSGMEAGTADAETYYSAVRDAYRLGMNGNFTLAEAIRATDSAAKISETQFRHAFELGQLRAGNQTTTADTADTQTRLDSALAVLGDDNAQIAAQAYQEGQDIDSYAAAMYKAAALYAANGRDLRTIVQQARSGQISDIVGRLTDAQVETAIQIGQQMAAQSEQQVQKATQRFQSLRDQAAAVQNSVVKGNVSVATKGGTIDGIKYDAVDESKLSEKQKQIISAVGAVADVLGLNVTVVSGQGGFGGAYTGKGNIFLNINSGMNLRGYSKAIAAGSFAHEMTHWLAENAQEEYKALKDIVIGNMSDKQLDALVQEQLRVQPNLKPEEALDEVVANACQPLLKDSKAFEQIARENMTLAERILDFLKEFTQKIKDAFADIDFKDNLPIYHAAQAVESHLDEMQKAFDKAIVAARENMAAERAVGTTTAETAFIQEAAAENGVDEATQLQVMEAAEEFMTDSENQAQIGTIDLRDYSKAVGTDGKPLFQVFAFEHDEPEYRKMLETAGLDGVDIDQLFDTVDRAMEKIMANLEVLDYAWERDIDDRVLKTVKPNSDHLYKVSIDFSTLCRKRIMQGLVQYQLQAALDRALTQEEGIAIRDALVELQKQGLQIEVACALCYVESARMKSPEQIRKFLANREQVIREYFAGKSKTFRNEAMRQAEQEERNKIYDEMGLIRGKGIDDTMYDVRDPKAAPLNKLPVTLKKRIQDVKKAAKASFAVTAEQQRIIDTAATLTITDFTTPEGLENLAKNHRELYDAYTSYIRNATKSKGIENDVWWRVGDSLESISDTLIANMNAENGLRTQSWSDFQVIHLMDYIAQTIELSTRHAKQHAYTKVIDYVDLMGKTGVMINMSLIPAAQYDGTLKFDDVEGIIYKEAIRMREKYHATAGTIAIGINNNQIRQLLASNLIDYVIPYHHSGMSKAVRLAMHIPGWDSYQDYQNEKKLSRSEAERNARRYGVELLPANDPNYHKAPAFSEWFDLKEAQRVVRVAGKEGKYGIMTGGYRAMQEAAERYKQMCAERGLAPKFSYGAGDFSTDDNYWKLLIDRKMVDNVTGDIIEQKPLKPNFDLGVINRILDDELARYGQVKQDQDEAIRRVSEAFLSGKVQGGMSLSQIAEAMKKPVDNVTDVNITESAKLQVWDDPAVREKAEKAIAYNNAQTETGSQLQTWDTEYMSAVKNGNTRVQERMVQEAAMRAGAIEDPNRPGKPLKLYHGTPSFGFTVFNTPTIFTTDNPSISSGYGGNIGYAEPRRISDVYTPDDGSFSTLKKNAESIMGRPIRKATDADRTKIIDELRKTAEQLQERQEKLWTDEAADTLYKILGDEVFTSDPDEYGYSRETDYDNALSYMFTPIWDMTGYYAEEFLDPNITGDIRNDLEKYFAYKGAFQRAVSDHWDEIKGTPAEDLANFARGFDIGDLAIYMQYSLMQSLREDAIVYEDTGKVGTEETLRQLIERQKDLGSYELYGFAGDNQLVVDGKGKIWYNLTVPGLVEEGTTTDSIMKKAKAAGYTSVLFKDLLDPAMNDYSSNIASNVYVFFDSNQVKSADRVTYDDSGDVIPLSERFKKEKPDIRFQTWDDSAVQTMENRAADRQHNAWAPTFYSKMQNTVNEWTGGNGKPLPAKMASNQVIGWLKGKGVKAEEIRWSGIQPWLEGKKSVTQQDLQAFMAENELHIETQVLGGETGRSSDTRWSEYTLKGGENYREILFKMPSLGGYSTQAMRTHWGETDVIAHARVQDMRTIWGKKVLFVEEIQSDLHNEGSTGKKSWGNRSAVDSETRDDTVPDVPFAGIADTYHEYVMKHLLRMAAEGGYDAIGWTTAHTQSRRWSAEYAKAYKIEYDQEIPKFMNKYCKQWGERANYTQIASGRSELGVQVWNVTINDAMRESVLTKGQPLFQVWDMTDDDTTTERKGRETAYARLQSENAVLRETVKELKRLSGKQKTTLANIQRQLQLTKDPETRLSDAKKLARQILKEYSSTADANSVAEAIKAVGDYLLNTNTDEVTEAELKSRARAVAMEVLDNASETLSFDEGDIEVNPYDAYIGEASEDLANRIVMDAMDGVLRPTAPTRADKQQARTQALKDRIQQLKAENKLEQREAARLYQTIYDLSLQLDKAQSRYETLRQKAEYREAEVRRQGAARAAEIKATERARAEGLLEEQKQHYLDIAKRARQRRENTTSRAKIRRLIDELNRRLAKPTEKRYVPQELIRLTVDILSVIDVDSGRGGENFAQKLERLRTMYDSYQKDPRYAAVYDEVAAEMLRDMCVKIGDTKLYSMNESQLETVYNTLKALTHIINDAIKVRIGTEERNAFEVAQEMTGETRQIPKAQRGWLKQHLLPAMLDPLRAFRRFGGNKMNSAWESVARMLDQGQLKQTDITMRLSMPFAELVNNAAAMRDFTGVNFFNHVDPKKLIDIGLKDENGNPVMVTHGIAAGIYMDLLNEDNRRHFIRGGKTVPNLKDYYTGRGGFGMGTTRAVGISTELSELYHEQREAKAEGDLSRVEDLQTQIDELMSDGESYADEVQRKIESQLTDFDREWIRLTQQLMDKDGKRYLNETTMDVYGIEKATVDHYYPITSDPNYLASNFESITRDMNLENVGFMKERVQSGNPTLAMDISSVVNEQIRRVAQYSGLMPAIRNFNKIWNKQSFGYSDSLKQAVNDVFGKEGRQYVENIIADLNGSRSVGEDSLGIGRLFGWLRGNLAQTSLTLNLRVALAQAASYPTAAAELGAGPLAKAFLRGGKKGRIISRADQELIAKYSPLLWYRMQGYSSIELGDIKNSQRLSSRIWKKARWATGWIQAVDGATVGRLWYAAEYWVQENMPSLEKGSEEYYQEVAMKFNDVVEKTQPNYTTMQRPQILRDPNEMVKMLTMFMTQRLQNFNILYDAAATYQKARADKANNRNGVTQADVAEARQDLTRAVASQLTAAAVYVGFGFLADAIYRNMKPYRDDDDGELTAESVSMALLDKYIDAIVGMVIGGSELHSILKAVTGNGKWYGLSLNGVDSLNDLIDDIVTLSSTDYDLSDEKSKEKFEKQLLKTVLSICQALGIPANNGIKIKNAIMNTITDAANGEFWSFNAGYNVTTAQQKLRDLEALGFSKDEAQQLLKDANTNGNSSISQEELYNYIQSHPDLTDEQILGLWNAQGWKTDYATYNAKQQKKATTAPDTSAPAAPAKGSTAAGGAKPAAESVAAAAEPDATQSTGITTYEQFYIVAPIYDTAKRTSVYGAWETALKPSGMSLQRFLDFLNAANVDGNNNIKKDEMGFALYDAMDRGEMTMAQAEAVWNGMNWAQDLQGWRRHHHNPDVLGTNN